MVIHFGKTKFHGKTIIIRIIQSMFPPKVTSNSFSENNQFQAYHSNSTLYVQF
jgi:hypothetical protein